MGYHLGTRYRLWLWDNSNWQYRTKCPIVMPPWTKLNLMFPAWSAFHVRWKQEWTRLQRDFSKIVSTSLLFLRATWVVHYLTWIPYNLWKFLCFRTSHRLSLFIALIRSSSSRDKIVAVAGICYKKCLCSRCFPSKFWKFFMSSIKETIG